MQPSDGAVYDGGGDRESGTLSHGADREARRDRGAGARRSCGLAPAARTRALRGPPTKPRPDPIRPSGASSSGEASETHPVLCPTLSDEQTPRPLPRQDVRPCASSRTGAAWPARSTGRSKSARRRSRRRRDQSDPGRKKGEGTDGRDDGENATEPEGRESHHDDDDDDSDREDKDATRRHALVGRRHADDGACVVRLTRDHRRDRRFPGARRPAPLCPRGWISSRSPSYYVNLLRTSDRQGPALRRRTSVSPGPGVPAAPSIRACAIRSPPRSGGGRKDIAGLDVYHEFGPLLETGKEPCVYDEPKTSYGTTPGFQHEVRAVGSSR
jgi:hypothetical protein